MKNFIMKYQKTVDGISRVFGTIAVICCTAMMILIIIDVILRKTINLPILGSYEIVQFLLMCLVFASFSYTQSEKGHIKVTMVSGKLPYRFRSLINGIFELSGAGLAFYCGYAAIIHGNYLFKSAWVSDVLRFKTYPFFYFEAIAMFYFMFVLLWDTLRHFYAVTDKEYSDEMAKEYS